MVKTRKYQEIKPVLMEITKPYIKEPYYIIKSNDQVIFVIASGLNGIEYNKNEGFISGYEGVVQYQCLYGQGLMLLQRNDELGEAKEFKITTINFGKQVSLPLGWGFCLVNIGKNLLVVLESRDLEEKEMITKPIFDKRGLAYYVVEKKGEIAFEQNPNYSVHPQISTE